MEVGEEKRMGENGLIKKLLKEGEGDDSPNTDDEVEVHYVALMDGIQFDSSTLHPDTTFIFKLGQGKGPVMERCDEGIKTMKKGEKALFTVPLELASVPPNSILQIEFELISWINVQDGEGEGVQNPIDLDLDEVVGRITKKVDKGKRKRSFDISYDDLKSHFGKKQSEAAKDIGVSKTTLRRICKSYGIVIWPPFWRKEKNSLKSSRSNKGDMIMVKAMFRDDIIKFELQFSLGVKKMMEEVEDRLKLNIGTFKLKYLDDDGDWILLACDKDLNHCMKKLRLAGKSSVRVLVQSQVQIDMCEVAQVTGQDYGSISEQDYGSISGSNSYV